MQKFTVDLQGCSIGSFNLYELEVPVKNIGVFVEGFVDELRKMGEEDG